MKPTLLIAVAALLPLEVRAQENDDFGARLAVEGLRVEVTANSNGATLEPGDPMGEELPGGDAAAGATLWWSWVAPEFGRFRISTVGSSFDTILGVYEGSQLAGLREIARNDDREGTLFGPSEVSFYAVAGREYQISVGGFLDPFAGADTGDLRWLLYRSPGPQAPEWWAYDLNGRLVRSHEFAGRAVLIDFWATWCGPCLAEIPFFNQMTDSFAPEELTIIGLATDPEGAPVVQPVVDEFEVNYPVLLSHSAVEEAFGGVDALPTAILISPEGEIVGRHVLFRDHDFWTRELTPIALHARDLNRPPPPVLQIDFEDGDIALRWTDDGRRFRVETRDLGVGDAWEPTRASVSLEASEWTARLEAAAAGQLYRLRVQ